MFFRVWVCGFGILLVTTQPPLLHEYVGFEGQQSCKAPKTVIYALYRMNGGMVTHLSRIAV